MDSGAVAGIVIGAVVVVAIVCAVIMLLRRRKRLQANFSLDAHERRFKRRLDRQMQEIDDIFEDEDEGGPDVELSAKDIEQLQLLEEELSRRAKGGSERTNLALPTSPPEACVLTLQNLVEQPQPQRQPQPQLKWTMSRVQLPQSLPQKAPPPSGPDEAPLALDQL